MLVFVFWMLEQVARSCCCLSHRHPLFTGTYFTSDIVEGWSLWAPCSQRLLYYMYNIIISLTCASPYNVTYGTRLLKNCWSVSSQRVTSATHELVGRLFSTRGNMRNETFGNVCLRRKGISCPKLKREMQWCLFSHDKTENGKGLQIRWHFTLR